MIKSISKIFGVLVALDIIMFFGMIVTAMTDERPPAIGRVFHLILKYILGFPLVIINNHYPFLLDDKQMPSIGILLIILNNIILSFIIWGIIKAFKRAG